MSIHESGEMYLETIHVLQKKNSVVRSVDIAEYMGYSKPSISRAVGLLKKQNYITVDSNGYISLTDAGLSVANKIYERHTVLSNLLVALGVDQEIAAEDACRLEHAMSDQSFEAFKKHLETLEK